MFKFGCNFKKWFSVTYNNIQSAVMNGGQMTEYFEITRGVRQGCPLSPSLFILTVELLALKIRQSPNCNEASFIGFNGNEARITQFADDTTIITNNSESLKAHLQAIEVFGAISGLKLNRKKTKAMWLGSMILVRYWNLKVRESQLKFGGSFSLIIKIRTLMKISSAELGK